MQGQLRNVQKSVMHAQSCCFAQINLLRQDWEGEGRGRGRERRGGGGGGVSLRVQSSDASKKTMLAFNSSCHGRFFISASFTLFVPIKNRVKLV